MSWLAQFWPPALAKRIHSLEVQMATLAELQTAIGQLSGAIDDGFQSITDAITTETQQVLDALAALGTAQVPQSLVDEVVNMKANLLMRVNAARLDIADTVPPS